MNEMFTILCFVVLCMSVGASDPHWIDDDVKSVIDEIFFKKYTEDISSTQVYPSKSTESSHRWSTTETTPRDYEVSHPGELPGSTKSSHEWSTTETTSRGYDASQPDEPEEYDPAYQPSHEKHPIRIGSIRGVPGENFPDYKDIPLTSFSCSDKAHVPGFYADMETGCQVFHVCWPHRRESFLCPIGTIFNQPILACDYWYSSNCSLASHYYGVNAVSWQKEAKSKKDSTLGSMVDSLLEKGRSTYHEGSTKHSSTYHEGSTKHSSTYHEGSTKHSSSSHDSDLSDFLKFLPVKSKVVVYQDSAEGISKVVAEASVGKGKRQKTPEEFTTEYIPVQPEYIASLKTSPPKAVQTESKHSHEIDSINRIIDEVFDIAKKIVREAEGLLPILNSMEAKAQKPVRVQKPYPLTKLNPRFITKPAAIPKPGTIYERSTVRPEKATKVPFQPTQKASPVTFKPQYKPVVRQTSNRKFSVSPLTKKALTENYIRMLKLRH